MKLADRAYIGAMEYAQRLGWQVIEERKPLFVALDAERKVAVKVRLQQGFATPIRFSPTERNRLRQEGVERFDSMSLLQIDADNAVLRHDRGLYDA